MLAYAVEYSVSVFNPDTARSTWGCFAFAEVNTPDGAVLKHRTVHNMGSWHVGHSSIKELRHIDNPDMRRRRTPVCADIQNLFADVVNARFVLNVSHSRSIA